MTDDAHPLDPLDAKEIEQACALARLAVTAARPDADLRFPVVMLAEPAKDALAAWSEGNGGIDRRAEVVVLDRVSGTVWEVLVSLPRDQVVSTTAVPGVVPVVLFEESFNAILALKEDPRWQEAVRRRGITDLEPVQVDPWPAGNFGFAREEGRRLVRCVSYDRSGPTDNGYAHPIEGVVALVDLATNEVLEVADEGVVPVPRTPGGFGPEDIGPVRDDLRPLDITQPDGPSFEIRGHEIRWQRWRFRFSVHPIEGLVLHTVGYEDGGRLRPILHRASIAEMVVPYGDIGASHWWKNAFDVGEWGLGRMMQSLTLGCDCLGEIRYFDAALADESGGARVVANAVCLHEEDFGIGWKHVDLWSGRSEVRRQRRLVISAISTVGNYDYGFYWYFYLDGTIQLEVKLTGVLQTAAVAPGQRPTHGTMIAPGLAAPNHQHLFCARLDTEIDGRSNSVYEVDTISTPRGPANPNGNAIVARSRLLRREGTAKRMIDQRKSRCWKIVNRGARNGVGEPVAYKLVPGSGVCLLADDDTSVGRRARFATRSLWVTPYRADERRPAGDYPNQSRGGDGLPAWTAADRPIVDTDVVLWHTFGVSHVARPEDWPVMPVEYAGFTLRPAGFFERNPALDVPPSAAHCHPDGG